MSWRSESMDWVNGLSRWTEFMDWVYGLSLWIESMDWDFGLSQLWDESVQTNNEWSSEDKKYDLERVYDFWISKNLKNQDILTKGRKKKGKIWVECGYYIWV